MLASPRHQIRMASGHLVHATRLVHWDSCFTQTIWIGMWNIRIESVQTLPAVDAVLGIYVNVCVPACSEDEILKLLHTQTEIERETHPGGRRWTSIALNAPHCINIETKTYIPKLLFSEPLSHWMRSSLAVGFTCSSESARHETVRFMPLPTASTST